MGWSAAKVAIVLGAAVSAGAFVRTKWHLNSLPTKRTSTNLLMSPDFGHPQSALVLEPEVLDLGNRAPHSTVECEFAVKNRGPTAITNVRTKTSCGCVTVHQPDSTLAPQSSTLFRVSMKVPSREGPHGETVFLITGDPPQARAMARIITNVVVPTTLPSDEPKGTITKLNPGKSIDVEQPKER